MKCHICKLNLRLIDQLGAHKKYECPNAHAQVVFHFHNIEKYILYWDADEFAKERYRLEGSFGSTCLYLKKYNDRGYLKILEMDHILPLQIEEETIQLNDVVRRLQKLKAFA